MEVGYTNMLLTTHLPVRQWNECFHGDTIHKRVGILLVLKLMEILGVDR